MSASGSGIPVNYEQGPQLKRESSTGSSNLTLTDAEVQPPDPAVPVFNIAAEMVKKCLWKEQVGPRSSRGAARRLHAGEPAPFA